MDGRRRWNGGTKEGELWEVIWGKTAKIKGHLSSMETEYRNCLKYIHI